jgi:hypothetical protein
MSVAPSASLCSGSARRFGSRRAPPATKLGFGARDQCWDHELACVINEKRPMFRGKLTPLERARIMAHLIGDFWSRVDEGQNRRHS